MSLDSALTPLVTQIPVLKGPGFHLAVAARELMGFSPRVAILLGLPKRKAIPQRLKPLAFFTINGTAEAVPLQNISC